MDWLMANNATLDCARKIVLLSVHTAQANISSESKFLSVVQAEKLVQQGCMAYIVFFSVHRVYDGSIYKIGVANEFLKVFTDDMSGLPPERKVEFIIDLVPGIEPILKAPYQMSPTELAELKKKIEELLVKGFIRPSMSPWRSPVLFVKKKDSSLQLYIDY
ncbi:uncharacterized protein LOC129310761 [Prosopis cineraria]|uniref:uncharacterized protein LOC129310761 n=1 Tax=Prosopis cineraria TaxID=364024 RepID=UPI00240F00DB|nr:uncharacterized protein LOC129310761 [Prosopis cineraria]